MHYHPNCSWCGIYYVELGQSSLNPPNGVNRFFPPFHTGYEDFGAAAIGQNAFATAPEEGKLVLFPAVMLPLSLLALRGAVQRSRRLGTIIEY